MVATLLQLHDDVHETRDGSLDTFAEGLVVSGEDQAVVLALLFGHLYAKDLLQLAGRGGDEGVGLGGDEGAVLGLERRRWRG